MIVSRLRVGAAAVLAAVNAAPIPAASPDPAVAGTYEVALCDGCDLTEVPETQRIRVSLYAEPIFVSGPLAGVDPPFTVKIYHRRVTLEHENYCFALFPDYEHGHVGAIYDTAIAVWTHTAGDSIRFPLYLSPDAGVEAEVTITDGRMHGVLKSWYVPGPPTQVIGHVVGRRIGPPDPEVCGLRDLASGEDGRSRG